jgi:probable F420-dependent oxidoreductase
MKFGIILPSYGSHVDRNQILETAQAADALNFDSAWLTDHLALPMQEAGRFATIYEAVTSMAFIAGQTQRIKLGTSTLVLPQRNPLEIAKQIASLDALSQGRVLLTCAIGWSPGEFANLGFEFKDRARRIEEAIHILRLLWLSKEAVSYAGKYYQFHDVMISPPPHEPGGPPIWLAGDSITAVRRAARLGDGWHPNTRKSQQLEQEIKLIHSLNQNQGFVIAMRCRMNFDAQPVDDMPLYGPIDKVQIAMREYAEIGLNYLMIHFDCADQKKRENQMRQFQVEIAPNFI